MISLVLAAAFFVGIHVFISGTRLRDTLAAHRGDQGFRGFFSALSLISMVWMVWAYRQAPTID